MVPGNEGAASQCSQCSPQSPRRVYDPNRPYTNALALIQAIDPFGNGKPYRVDPPITSSLQGFIEETPEKPPKTKGKA